eukprot:111172-Pelagomonas_calceolata.AAC.1
MFPTFSFRHHHSPEGRASPDNDSPEANMSSYLNFSCCSTAPKELLLKLVGYIGKVRKRCRDPGAGLGKGHR